MLLVNGDGAALALAATASAASQSLRVRSTADSIYRTRAILRDEEMLKRLLAVAAVLILGACQRSDVKVLIGATVIVAPGAQPIDDSIIIVAGHTIRSVGMRRDIPIPQDSERSDLSGKWVVPADGSRIGVGESANILVLDRAPNGVKPQEAGDVSRRLVAGDWR